MPHRPVAVATDKGESRSSDGTEFALRTGVTNRLESRIGNQSKNGIIKRLSVWTEPDGSLGMEMVVIQDITEGQQTIIPGVQSIHHDQV